MPNQIRTAAEKPFSLKSIMGPLIAAFIARVSTEIRKEILLLVTWLIVMILSGVFSAHIGFLSAFHPVIAVLLFMRVTNVIRKIDGRAIHNHDQQVGV